MGLFIINISGIPSFSVSPISLGSRKSQISFSWIVWIVLSRRYSRPSVVHAQDNRAIARRKTFSWWRNNVAFQPTPRLYRKRRETSHFWSSDPPRIILKLCHSRWIIDQRGQKIVTRIDKIVCICMSWKATSEQVTASVYFRWIRRMTHWQIHEAAVASLSLHKKTTADDILPRGLSLFVRSWCSLFQSSVF